MKKLLPALVLVCLCVQQSHARSSRLYGSGEMSSNLISDICLDGQGFVWVATEYGLNRFDGFSFRQYFNNPSDSTSLLGNNVRTLFLDSEKTLWVGCSNGLQYYSAEEDAFVHITIPSQYSPHVSAMAELDDGKLWFVTSGQGVYQLEKSEKKATYLDELTRLIGTQFCSCIYKTSSGMVWIGTDSKGAVMVDFRSGTVIETYTPESDETRINDIVEDGAGNVFLSASTKIVRYDPLTKTFSDVPYAEDQYIAVRAMMKSWDGGIFVGTDGQGLQFLDTKNFKLAPVGTDNGDLDMSDARIYALAEAPQQSMWIGCAQKGVLMISHAPTQFDFLRLPSRAGELGGSVNSIYRDHEGDILCAADNEGLLVFNYRGDIIRQFPQIKAAAFVFEDSRNRIWLRSRDEGTMILDKKSGRVTPVEIPANGFVKTIAEDKAQNLYISMFGAGFVRHNLITGQWEHYEMRRGDSTEGGLANDWINVILCDSRGLVWLGHYRGISCYDPSQDKFLSTGLEDALKDQICISMAEDINGNIWAGTYNGLFRIDPLDGTVQSYTTANGLSSNMICGVAIDPGGNVWCSTFNGINQLDVSEQRFISYYSGNGLEDKAYNRGVYFTDADGVIYFGGDNGITMFSPGDINLSDYANRVSVVNLFVHNKPVNRHSLSAGKKIIRTGRLDDGDFHMAYGDNTFTLELATMDFKDTDNIHFEYRLKNLNETWSATIPGQNHITYNHLNPGKYTLEVRAAKYGALSPAREFSINIRPPWHRSLPAYIIYMVCLLALTVLIIYTVGKKRREVVNEAKLQFFINISHEIRSPLTLIISPLEKLLKGTHDPSTGATLNNMYRNAQRILGLVNQLLDIRKIDKGQMRLKFTETDLVGFIGELFEIFDFQAGRRNIRFSFEHLMDQLLVWIDRNNFDKILMNILSNAFKFTPDGGEVAIILTSGIDSDTLGTLRHYAQIRITDTGQGIDEDKIEKIFTLFYQAQNEHSFGTMGSGIGLNLSRTLVEMHQGTITASNRHEMRGACFTIRIPLGNEHLKKEEINPQSAPATRDVLRQLAEEYSGPAKRKYTRSKTNYKILVVDDEPEIRDFIRSELEQTYRVLTAPDGEQAMKTVFEQMPDLIISDVVMPVMDGFTLLGKLKTNSNVSHIPVIMLTSKTEHDDRMEGLDKGAEAYLTKPFNTDELLLTVENLIKNRRLLRGKFSGAQDQKDKVKAVEFKSGDEKMMGRIMTILNNNIENPQLNVEMLAREVGISRVQLHRKLKELTGLSSSEFIRELRLKQAAELLREKRMDISQIAYSVGFSNRTHFSTAFRKFYGISPSEYIQKSTDNGSADQ
jgi:signal transduction histidine kinase/DNA-binding response OmpR family regulator/ligand-binding sensor domain-containing protein